MGNVAASTLLWSAPREAAGPAVFTADGARILRGTKDTGLSVFDVASASLEKTLPGADAFVVPHDPTIVGQLKWDGTLSIVRIADGSVLRTVENVRNAVFLDNGAIVYAAKDHSGVFIVEADAGEPRTVIGPYSNGWLTATGNRFLLTDDPPRLFSSEDDGLKEIDLGAPPELSYLARVSADGKSIVGITLSAVFVYDVESKSVRWRREMPAKYVHKLDWLAGDKRVLVSNSSTMSALNAETGEVVWDKPGSPPVADVSPDKKVILGFDSVAPFFDAATGQLMRINDFGFGGGWGISISPDRRRVVYANWNGHLLSRDVVTGEILWSSMPTDTNHNLGGIFRRVAASPDESLLLVTRLEGPFTVNTHVVEPTTGRVVKTIRVAIPGNPNLPNLGVVAASSDNKLLAVADHDGVAVANIQTGETIRSRVIQTNAFAMGIAFVQDNQAVAVGFSNGEIKILAIEGEGEIRTLTGGSGSMKVSRDGSLFAAREYAYWETPGKKISVWRSSDLTKLHTIEPASAAMAIAFSEDGKFLLAGGDKEVAVWSVATGRQVTTIPAPKSGAVQWLASSGNFLGIGSGEAVQMYTALSGVQANLAEGSLSLSWQSLMGPFTIESASTVKGPWSSVTVTEGNSMELPVGDGQRFFRVIGP